MANNVGPGSASTPGQVLKVRVYKRKPGETVDRVITYARHSLGVRVIGTRHSDVSQAVLAGIRRAGEQ
jgi:CelD/BcsL family acetyltransferase involved in cellulose biosynthesis